MKIILNVAFGIAIFWFTTSVRAAGQLGLGKFNYSRLDTYYGNSDTSTETREEADDYTEEVISPVARSSVPQTPVLWVTTSSASSALLSGASSSSPDSSSSPPSSSITLNSHEIQELNRILQQDTTNSSSPKSSQVTEHITISRTNASSVGQSNSNGSSTDGMLTNGTSSAMTSAPDVVLPTKQAKTYIDDIFKQSLAWLGDTYTLSIVVPILAGFLFAVVIIVTLAVFSCIRRRCRRRRLRRKILPGTIRKMGPSDRARLLAETSDEEF